MRILFLVLAFFCQVVLANEVGIKEKVKQIVKVSKSDFDSSIVMANDLLDESKEQDFDEGIVQSYFTLAYLYKNNGDYAKSIIFYLEAIRYAEDSDYEGVQATLSSLYKNSGNIFREFNSHSLAREYFEKSIRIAEKLNDIHQVISNKYNLSGVFLDEEDYSGAAFLLESLLQMEEASESKLYYDILNRLAYAHLKNNDFESAATYAKVIVDSTSVAKPKLVAFAYHNLGAVASKKEEFQLSNQYFNSGLEYIIKEENLVDKTAEFELLHNQGRNLVLWDKSEEALKVYHTAESMIPTLTQQPKYFELYQDIATVYFDMKDYDLSKKYTDLYSESMNKYLELKEEIQQTDKSYNMDLITKRYFDEVAKQERIASILFYSKLISGTLLALLLMTIGYNWYQKVKLRKSIVQELMDLKVIN
ncbi:tetratricopeptide repeat protein [Ekhidna sp.]|uniref:tetratricopeptide repeat protein n=1 Tax=Ekhidna sp. TaxID=2608089 RepID=UPI003CCBF309